MKEIREFLPVDRYVFDFRHCRSVDGWAQIDTRQDAHYYGIWANPFTLEIITYTEGDVVKKKAEAPSEFCSEMDELIEWHRSRDDLRGIDPGLIDANRRRWIDLGYAKYLH